MRASALVLALFALFVFASSALVVVPAVVSGRFWLDRDVPGVGAMVLATGALLCATAGRRRSTPIDRSGAFLWLGTAVAVVAFLLTLVS